MHIGYFLFRIHPDLLCYTNKEALHDASNIAFTLCVRFPFDNHNSNKIKRYKSNIWKIIWSSLL